MDVSLLAPSRMATAILPEARKASTAPRLAFKEKVKGNLRFPLDFYLSWMSPRFPPGFPRREKAGREAIF